MRSEWVSKCTLVQWFMSGPLHGQPHKLPWGLEWLRKITRVLHLVLLLLFCWFWNCVCRFRRFHVQWDKWPKPRWVSASLSAGLFGENCSRNPPSAGPRSKAASALILKLLSASQHWQQTSHNNDTNKKTKNQRSGALVVLLLRCSGPPSFF